MVSALGNGVKGGKWYSLMDKVVRPTTLAAAWRKVARHHGAAGVDRQSIERFAAKPNGICRSFSTVWRTAATGRTRVKRCSFILKRRGANPSARDPNGHANRIVQTALKMVIEPIFETQFRPCSYGFLPGRSCKDALREVDRLLTRGSPWWWMPICRAISTASRTPG